MLAATIPLIPFVGALCVALLPDAMRRAWLLLAAIAVPLLVLALAVSVVPEVMAGEVLRASLSWLPRAGLNLDLRIDALALLFVLLIAGIGVMIVFYARYYLSAADSLRRLYALLLLFMGAMLGVVTAGNLLILVVFWELTSLSSFLLIGYWSSRAESRRGARLALAVTGGGGLALLAGALLIGHVVGSFALDDVLASGDVLRNHALYPLILALVLLGAFSKSAQVPLHFWLPHAMAAPTPVSAYLHSATMVKVGIFLMARLHPALAGTELWTLVVASAGAITLLTGAYIALFKHDLKAILAYSTVSHLGLMTLLLGLGTRGAALAALFHLVAHALFKAPLFMAAGIVDHATGTRDIRQLGGLWRIMPATMLCAAVATAAMAGLPLVSGYLSKRMFLAETLASLPAGWFGVVLLTAVVLAGVLSVSYSLRFFVGTFFGRPGDARLLTQAHDVAWPMWLPLALFAMLTLAIGLLPDGVLGWKLAAATEALLQQDISVNPLAQTLAASGYGGDFLISLIALGLGVAVYLLHAQISTTIARMRWPDARRIAERLLLGMDWLAVRGIRGTENGSLQRYAALLIGSAVLLAFVALRDLEQLLGSVAMSRPDLATTIGLLVLTGTALATAILHRHRLLALLLMGASGLLVTLVFARFSAPDLALTQLSVEVMAVVILMLALSFLPQRSPVESGRGQRIRNVLLAAAAGVGVTVLSLAVLTRPYDSIADYFLAHSLDLGGGTNVVNVILVDFRGFDTLGEITVLGIAALAIFIMTQALQLTERVAPHKGQLDNVTAHPLFLRIVSRPVLPMGLLVAAYIFLRGHNQPGGGFIAGLIAAVAFTLQYMANGLDWTHERRRTFFRPVVAAGILVAGLTGLGSLVFGYPFLTAWFTHLSLPLIGDVEIATVIAFDLGVFLTVVGATLLILSNMGKLMTIHGPGKERG